MWGRYHLTGTLDDANYSILQIFHFRSPPRNSKSIQFRSPGTNSEVDPSFFSSKKNSQGNVRAARVTVTSLKLTSKSPLKYRPFDAPYGNDCLKKPAIFRWYVSFREGMVGECWYLWCCEKCNCLPSTKQRCFWDTGLFRRVLHLKPPCKLTVIRGYKLHADKIPDFLKWRVRCISPIFFF